MKTGDNFELPAGDTNHGGYFQNSSRDSFVEGFAEFYSMMVSRHIDGDQNAEIYTIGAGTISNPTACHGKPKAGAKNSPLPVCCSTSSTMTATTLRQHPPLPA